MVPVFKEPYRETVEMGQTKPKHTGAQFIHVWWFMVLWLQVKTMKKLTLANFHKNVICWQNMGSFTKWKKKKPAESIGLEEAGQLGSEMTGASRHSFWSAAAGTKSDNCFAHISVLLHCSKPL